MLFRSLDGMIYESCLTPDRDIFEGDGLATEFTLSREPESVSSVTVNGTDLDAGAWSVSGNVLAVSETPEDGSEIVIVYKYRALLDVAASVVADVVMREISAVTSEGSPMLAQATQYTESAMGYSQSFTLPNTGGGVFIKRSELARLGLRRQRYGVLDFYGMEE
mgnify:CR=1 FL=1